MPVGLFPPAPAPVPAATPLRGRVLLLALGIAPNGTLRPAVIADMTMPGEEKDAGEEEEGDGGKGEKWSLAWAWMNYTAVQLARQDE